MSWRIFTRVSQVSICVILLSQHSLRGMTFNFFDPQAAKKYSCETMFEFIELNRLAVPIGFTPIEFAELLRRMRIVNDWSKFEAIIVTGSRTHFSFGVKPETEGNGEAESDIDIMVVPTPAWKENQRFGREYDEANDQMLRSLIQQPLFKQRVELFRNWGMAIPIDQMALPTKEIERQVEELRQREEGGVFESREEEKKFYLRTIGRLSGWRRGPVLTTEAIVILPSTQSRTPSLEKRLKDRGFTNVAVID